MAVFFICTQIFAAEEFVLSYPRLEITFKNLPRNAKYAEFFLHADSKALLEIEQNTPNDLSEWGFTTNSPFIQYNDDNWVSLSAYVFPQNKVKLIEFSQDSYNMWNNSYLEVFDLDHDSTSCKHDEWLFKIAILDIDGKILKMSDKIYLETKEMVEPQNSAIVHKIVFNFKGKIKQPLGNISGYRINSLEQSHYLANLWDWVFRILVIVLIVLCVIQLLCLWTLNMENNWLKDKSKIKK